MVVMEMGSLWVYGGGYGFGPNLCCVAVGLGVVGGGSLFWINFSGAEFGVCG